jgi:hypothetical protein
MARQMLYRQTSRRRMTARNAISAAANSEFPGVYLEFVAESSEATHGQIGLGGRIGLVRISKPQDSTHPPRRIEAKIADGSTPQPKG